MVVDVSGPGAFRTEVDGIAHEIRRRGGAWWVDGEKVGAAIVKGEAGVSVFWGNGYHFDLPDPLDRGSDAAGAAGQVDAPMPGQVKSVHVSAGASVEKGDRLVVLEAMKMEHVLVAARAGVVAEVVARAGDQVEAGAALIILEEEP